MAVRLFLFCFLRYTLSLLEFWQPVWGSAFESHLRLLGHVVSWATLLLDGVYQCIFGHGDRHPFRQLLQERCVSFDNTGRVVSFQEFVLLAIRYRTLQCGRTLATLVVALGNMSDISLCICL